MRRASLWPYAAIIVIGPLIGRLLASAIPKETFLRWLLLPAAALLAGFFFYALLVLRRNKKAVKASPEQQRAALEFQPVAGKAVLYVFRHQSIGLLQGHDLGLDGRCLGQTRGCTFYRLELEPGKHCVSGDKECLEALEMEVAAGQVYLVEQELLQGMWRAGYHYLPRENAMQTRWAVQECKMLLPVGENAG
jgi:hypothetical protein